MKQNRRHSRGGAPADSAIRKRSPQTVCTPLTSGTMARTRRSIPCLTVTEEMGQAPHAPSKRRCSTPASSTVTNSTSPPSICSAGRIVSSEDSIRSRRLDGVSAGEEEVIIRSNVPPTARRGQASHPVEARLLQEVPALPGVAGATLARIRTRSGRSDG